ncbi:MAG: DUF2490 domain-containing protein [Bacteroidia bacterium]
MYKRLALFVLLVVVYRYLIAQSSENQMNFSYLYLGQLRISDSWSIHTDVQEVNYEALNHFSQVIIRVGANYHLKGGSILTSGIGYVRSVPFDESTLDSASDELRLWQDVRLKNTLGRLKVGHRYRFEERWVTNGADTKFSYRTRYHLSFTIPINHKEIKPGTVSLAIFDEIFINMPDLNLGLNRISGGLGYQLNPTTSLQISYQHSVGNGDISRRIQTGLFWRPDFRKAKKST